MKRNAENYLDKWMAARRRKPLVLRGARQVGKSTLVRQFAAKHGLILNEVNLERHLNLDKIFASLDIAVICAELEALVGRSITEPGSILFLDEIQATPSALQALRYFYEDMPDIPVIAAGSLLEFTLSEHSFSMPVGRIEYFHLGPMTFREFLLAIEPELNRYLDQLSFDTLLPETAHKKLLMRQRQFMLVGGMPEAVLSFQESGSFENVASIHRSIVNTYEDDFTKYGQRHDIALLQQVFRQIPLKVGQKVKYVNFSREDRSRDVKAAINLLAKARVCHRVFASHCSGVPLYADINDTVYKLLFLDIGLMNNLCGMDWSSLNRMDERKLVNEGALAEQFIGQHLVYSGQGVEQPRLVYWLREGRDTNAEIDYVISIGPDIFPVEVKAGKTGTLRSLQQFVAQKKRPVAIRFDLNQPNRQHVSHQASTSDGLMKIEFELLSLPLYAVCEIHRMPN